MSTPRRAAIVDYGMGNLFSVRHACARVGLNAVVTSRREEVEAAPAIILPGVGAFDGAMAALDKLDLCGSLQDAVAAGKPLLAICLGMQLLAEESFEFGRHQGLGLVKGQVLPLEEPSEDGRVLKVPHVGWSRLHTPQETSWRESLLDGLGSGEYMYFVHSFYVEPKDKSLIRSITNYGSIGFCSSLEQGSIFACQFHPERSGPQGIKIYERFAAQVQTAQRL